MLTFISKKHNFSNPVNLKDLTKVIFRGFQIPSEMIDEFITDEDTKIKLLTLTSIVDGEIQKSELSSLKVVDKRMEHYRLESGDLVISCKGKTFKTAVENTADNYQAGASLPKGNSHMSVQCSKHTCVL